LDKPPERVKGEPLTSILAIEYIIRQGKARINFLCFRSMVLSRGARKLISYSFGLGWGMNGIKETGGKKNVRTGRDLLWLSTLGINLVLAGAAGVAIGYFLDKWFNTPPVMTIIFFCIGTFAGFRQIYKEVRKLGSDDKKNGNK
jgi:ATP synthase protein I